MLFVSSDARIGPVPQASFDLLEGARLVERILAGNTMPDLVRVRELVSEPHTLSGAAEVMTEAGVADVPDRLLGWSLPPEAEQFGREV